MIQGVVNFIAVIAFLIFVGVLAAQIFQSVKKRLTKVNFLNKTVWITGASSGIGENLTYKFIDAGASVIISARRIDELERVRNACSNPDKVMILPLDNSNPEEAGKVAAEFFKQKSITVDILVNNAGASQKTLFLETPHEVEKELLNLNLVAPMVLTRIVLPDMLKQKSGQVVMINSVEGKMATPMRTSYATTKFGLRGFADSLRAEYEDQGIYVTSIYPGYVKTDVSKSSRVEPNKGFGHQDKNIKYGQPADDFAEKAIKVIYFKERDVMISKDFTHYFEKFVSALAPNYLFKRMRDKKPQFLEARKEALEGKYDQ